MKKITIFRSRELMFCRVLRNMLQDHYGTSAEFAVTEFMNSNADVVVYLQHDHTVDLLHDILIYAGRFSERILTKTT